MMLTLKRIFLLIVDIFLVTLASDAALKRTIIEHGPCRPKDPKHFSSRDEKKTFLWNIIVKLQITLQYRGYGYIIPLHYKNPIVTAYSLLAA